MASIGQGFVEELTVFQRERLLPIVQAGQASLNAGQLDAPGDLKKLLQVAFGNELNVTELARAWLDTTTENDVKAAFAKQAEDESAHAKLVSDRLSALGIVLAPATAPPSHPLFDYVRTLSSTAERIAASLFTLEEMAFAVNENFIALCEQKGDAETVRMYRDFIQPDERLHQQMGRHLLAEHARDAQSQAAARAVVDKVLAIAASARTQAALKLGTACVPGC